MIQVYEEHVMNTQNSGSVKTEAVVKEDNHPTSLTGIDYNNSNFFRTLPTVAANDVGEVIIKQEKLMPPVEKEPLSTDVVRSFQLFLPSSSLFFSNFLEYATNCRH